MISFNKSYLFAVAAGAALLSSCSKEMDFSDPNANIKAYEKNWGDKFGEIDPNQNWNMATSKQAVISITEDALAKYTFQLFSANPLYDASARLLANYNVETDAQGKASVSFDFDVLTSATQVYAVRIDAVNRRVVKAVDITADGVKVNFGIATNITNAAKAVTRGDFDGKITSHDLPTMACPYTLAEVNNMIANAYDLKDGLNYPNPYNPTADDMYINSIADYEGGNGGLNKVIKDRNSKGANYILNTVKITTTMTPELNLEAEYGCEAGRNKIIIADGGVYTPKGRWSGVDIIVANGGTLDLTSQPIYIGENSRLIVMPGGKVIDNSTNKHQYSYSINFQGVGIYNAGTMNVPVMNLNNGTGGISALYNADGGVINSDIIVFNNSNTAITNYGKIVTNQITGNGNQGTVNNGCNLIVKDMFKVCNLNLAANSELRCKELNFQGYVTLRENSILRCDEFYANLTDISYVGKAEQAAIISTDNVKFINVGPGGFAMSGRIYFETNTIGVGGQVNVDAATNVLNEQSKNILGMSKVGEANYSIPTGDCTGQGNKPTTDPDPVPDPEAQSWVIACEDLGDAGDIDFNDVVFSVSHVSGTNTATITPLAAGGELPSTVRYNGQPVADNAEIHHLLQPNVSAGDNGHYPLLWNVPAGDPLTIVVDENFSMTNHKFSITAEGNGDSRSITMGNETGKAPMMLCLPGAWAWPKEHTQIYEAYPMFRSWVQNSNDNEWYKNFVEDKVVK